VIQSFSNRIVNGDKYAVAPFPVVSVFDLLIRMLPDPSPASAISSTNSDTNSSRLHIVSYATATNARSLMSLKFRGPTDKKSSISAQVSPCAWRCRAGALRPISFKASFTSSVAVGSKTPDARCARPASANTVREFVFECLAKDKKPATIRRYVS
jgi:hypothetical protein